MGNRSNIRAIPRGGQPRSAAVRPSNSTTLRCTGVSSVTRGMLAGYGEASRNPPRPQHNLACHAVGWCGIHRTTDAGQTWQRLEVSGMASGWRPYGAGWPAAARRPSLEPRGEGQAVRRAGPQAGGAGWPFGHRREPGRCSAAWQRSTYYRNENQYSGQIPQESSRGARCSANPTVSLPSRAATTSDPAPRSSGFWGLTPPPNATDVGAQAGRIRSAPSPAAEQ